MLGLLCHPFTSVNGSAWVISHEPPASASATFPLYSHPHVYLKKKCRSANKDKPAGTVFTFGARNVRFYYSATSAPLKMKDLL